MGFKVVSGGVKSTGNLLLDEPTIPKFKVISGGEKTAPITEPKFKVVAEPKPTPKFIGKPKNWVAEGLKKTVSDIGQGFADVPAQVQDLLTMPARVLGTPHPPMVSKLATQINEPVADFNLPVLTPRNIKPLFTGKFKNIETTPVSPSILDIGLNAAAVGGPLFANIKSAVQYNQQLRQQLARPIVESILRARAGAIDVPGEVVTPKTELPLPKPVEPGKALVPVQKPVITPEAPKTLVSSLPAQPESIIPGKTGIGPVFTGKTQSPSEIPTANGGIIPVVVGGEGVKFKVKGITPGVGEIKELASPLDKQGQANLTDTERITRAKQNIELLKDGDKVRDPISGNEYIVEKTPKGSIRLWTNVNGEVGSLVADITAGKGKTTAFENLELSKPTEGKVYHETSITSLRDLMATGDASGLNVSDNPDLAIGQGGKGVKIEFDKSKLLGSRGSLGKIKKPGLPLSESMGLGTEYRLIGGETGIDKISKITLEPGTKIDKVTQAILQRQFDSKKLENGNWEFTPKLFTPTGEGQKPSGMQIFRMDEPVIVNNTSGKQITLPKGEEYRTYDLGNGKVRLQDGKQITVYEGELSKLKGKLLLPGEQPMAGGMSHFEKRKEIMQKRLAEVSLAKEELQSLNAIRNQLRGRIQKYKGAYLKEELGGIPRFYITTQQGIKPDEIIVEINNSNFGVQLQNEQELKDWLIGLEKRRKELVTRIETNRPELEAHKESTLLAQEGKIRQQEIKKFTGQAKKAATEAAKITTRLQGKAFREGKATASEQRKVAYFGEQISKDERSKLYLMAKEKGLYYTDFTGRPHDILKGLLKYYQGASFDQLREYITNLTGDPENPPKLFKLFGDITKDTEVIKLLKQVTSKWQDINKVEMNTLDPVRIVEKVTGQDLWDNVLADNTFNVYAAADEAMYDRLVQLLNELDVNRQGVNKKSKESQEIMRKFETGETLTEKEQKVVDYLRKKYDALIAEANEMRARLKKRPIPYRQDYMTHIREQNMLSDFFKGDLDAAKNISLGQLDAIRKGDYTKGNMPFNRFALKRTGPKTKFDAIGNYEIYLRTMLKEIYYTPAITHARKFIEYALIRQPNAYMSLDRLANDLKGKTSLNDKWFGGVLLSTKPIKKMRSLIAKSALLGNLNFWIMNSSNFVVSYDELGNYMNKGMAKFLGTKKWRQFAFKNSNMLKGRTIDPDVDPGSFKTIEAALGYITNLLEYNNVGSTFVGAYFKGIDQGFNQAKAIKYADAIARRTQVGYKKYELNAWMRSNSGMFLSQFQTWTFNAMNHLIYDLKLGNVPGNLVSKFTGKGKKPVRWGAFFTLVVISMLVNYMYKKAGLREPYGPDSAVPRIPGIGGAVPPIIRVGQNVVSAVTSKKPETREKAAMRAVSSFVPAGTQVNRFFQGKVFPVQPEEKKVVKFPSKFKSKFPAKFKSKLK